MMIPRSLRVGLDWWHDRFYDKRGEQCFDDQLSGSLYRNLSTLRD
jgi:hypothetical protein